MTTKKWLSRRDEIKAALEQCDSVSEVGRMFGVTRERMRVILKDLGLMDCFQEKRRSHCQLVDEIVQASELIRASALQRIQRVRRGEMAEDRLKEPKYGRASLVGYSEDAIKRLAEDFKGGKTISAIAKENGINQVTLSKKFKNLGIDTKLNHYKHFSNVDRSPINVRRIIAAYQGGCSLTTIAEAQGISHVTVRKILIENGVEIRKGGRAINSKASKKKIQD